MVTIDFTKEELNLMKSCVNKTIECVINSGYDKENKREVENALDCLHSLKDKLGD